MIGFILNQLCQQIHCLLPADGDLCRLQQLLGVHLGKVLDAVLRQELAQVVHADAESVHQVCDVLHLGGLLVYGPHRVIVAIEVAGYRDVGLPLLLVELDLYGGLLVTAFDILANLEIIKII